MCPPMIPNGFEDMPIMGAITVASKCRMTDMSNGAALVLVPNSVLPFSLSYILHIAPFIT